MKAAPRIRLARLHVRKEQDLLLPLLRLLVLLELPTEGKVVIVQILAVVLVVVAPLGGRDPREDLLAILRVEIVHRAAHELRNRPGRQLAQILVELGVLDRLLRLLLQELHLLAQERQLCAGGSFFIIATVFSLTFIIDKIRPAPASNSVESAVQRLMSSSAAAFVAALLTTCTACCCTICACCVRSESFAYEAWSRLTDS